MLKMSLGLASSAALLMMLANGCSSSETPVGGGDSGTTPASDASTKKDGTTGTSDGGTTETCSPGDVASFKPTWKVPAAFGTKKCTDLQIEALMCAIDDNADQATCDKASKDAANKDCLACIYTPSSAKNPGPLMVSTSGGVISLNIAGCIANSEGKTTAADCGAKVQAADQCADEACEANCPTDTTEGFKAFQACTEAALSGGCESFSTDAACAEDLTKAGGAAEKCLEGTGFLERATNLATLFCGGGTATTDGGTDAAKDSPTEGG